MKYVSFKTVSKKCQKNRYFPYDTIQDRIFLPISLFFTWACVCLQISANTVSWISGIVTIIGAILISSDNYLYILIGSFSYILWYLLDYVDGAVARYNDQGSIEGQYIDWLMHVVSSTAITIGIAFGAIKSGATFVVPCAILAILAAVLSYAKYSMAWWSIVMERQQKIAKNFEEKIIFTQNKIQEKDTYFYSYFRSLSILIFHENYLIFSLPIFGFIQFYFLQDNFDLRVIYIYLATSIHFPIVFLEIQKLIKKKKLSSSYRNLFINDKIPNLPNDHFFK